MKKLTESGEFNNLTRKAHTYKFGSADWSDWGLLFRFLIIICKLLEKGKAQSKRKPSKWSLFAGKQMHQGKTIKEASRLWKKKNH